MDRAAFQVDVPEEGGVHQGRLLLLVKSGDLGDIGLLVHGDCTRHLHSQYSRLESVE